MKKQKPLRFILLCTAIALAVGIYMYHEQKMMHIAKKETRKEEKQIKKEYDETMQIQKNQEKKIEAEEIAVQRPPEPPIVYDGLTMQQLSEKLDRSLSSTLSGYGSTFASLSLQYNMDPYLVVAIVLQETGCKWGCSYLVRNCNNIGGMKGSPACAGSYRSFETIEIGIDAYIQNLYYNYYMQGLTTAEAMNHKYAESTSWAAYVNQYIEEIKAK